MKIAKIIIIGLLLLIGTGFIGANIFAKIESNNIEISNIEFSSIDDGVYYGTHETRMVMADVEVKVKDGKVIEITVLKHECGRGYKAEKIIDDIMERQSLDVDSVSGATLSSKIIRKAIENAINQ
jgi:uncharacterized protein with FMN-binding domain